MIIPIEQVKSSVNRLGVPYYGIRKMMVVLNKQGQIEPLQVRKVADNTYETFNEDAWGSEIVYAANELGWTTLLIVEVDKYIP